MSPFLVLLLALAPQEDDSRRAREAAFGLPGFQVKAPPPAPAPEQGPPGSFMTPRVKREANDYKDLLDHNVFSPPRARKETPKPSGDGPKSEGPKTRKWVLTGIVFNARDNRYEGLIQPEDAPRDAKFLKAGDTVAGATITEVTFEQVAFKRGETPGVLKLKDALSETVAGSGPAVPAKVEDPGEVEKARERMKKRHRRESVPDEAEEEADSGKKPK